MRYETLILIFIRAHREQNFNVYSEVLEGPALLFFALKYVNYGRWIPVHIRDVNSSPDTPRISSSSIPTGIYPRYLTSFQTFPLSKLMHRRRPITNQPHQILCSHSSEFIGCLSQFHSYMYILFV